MTMGRINDNGVSTRINECLHTVEGVGRHAYTGSHAQTTFLILTGHRLVLGLRNVLIGNQTHEMVVLVHHGQFLDLILLQDLSGRDQVGLLMGGHEMIFRHDLIHRSVELPFEAQVAVGHDTNEAFLFIDHGNTTDMILRHDIQGLGNGRAEGDSHGVIDHTVLSTLDNSHLTCLFLDRHVLVDHADATFAGNGDCHLRLRHGIHRCRHKWHVQLDVPREAGFQLYHLG